MATPKGSGVDLEKELNCSVSTYLLAYLGFTQHLSNMRYGGGSLGWRFLSLIYGHDR